MTTTGPNHNLVATILKGPVMTQERGEHTLALIVRTATRLFALHGYFHTGMNDILEAISLSKGAFYYHFKGKEQLALAVLGQLKIDYEKELFEPLRQLLRPEDRLRRMFTLLEQLNQSGTWCNDLLLVRMAAETNSLQDDLARQVTQLMEQVHGFIERLLSDAHTDGLIHPLITPATGAKLILAGWLGGVLLQEQNPEQCPLADTLTSLQTMIMKAPWPPSKD